MKTGAVNFSPLVLFLSEGASEMPLKDLIIEDIVVGTGPAVKSGDPVSVQRPA